MSFQLKAIGLYNKNNDFHQLDFNLNYTNIITGDKDTGKSSILSIINYCLCSTKSEGIKDYIFNIVEFYGLHLVDQITNQEMIIIRKRPPSQEDASEEFYIIESNTVVFPYEIRTISKFDLQTAKIKLAMFTKLDPEFHAEESSYPVSIRHSLSINFLDYNTLGHYQYYFYKQNDFFISVLLKSFPLIF